MLEVDRDDLAPSSASSTSGHGHDDRAQLVPERHRAWAHHRPAEFDFAGRIEVDDESDDPSFAAELVFAICNSYPTEMHTSDQYLDQVRAYRHGRHRSLSMGDVIAIGEGFWFCASSGWDPIVSPSPNLQAAFMSAMVKES